MGTGELMGAGLFLAGALAGFAAGYGAALWRLLRRAGECQPWPD